MADELALNFSVNVNKSNLQHLYQFSDTITINGTRKSAQTTSVATTAAGTAIVVSGVGTLGTAIIRNHDSANYVEVGVQVGGAFYPLLRVNAGEAWLFRFAQGVTPYWRANGAAVLTELQMIDD